MVDMGREEGLTQTSVGDALEACGLKEEVSPGLYGSHEPHVAMWLSEWKLKLNNIENSVPTSPSFKCSGATCILQKISITVESSSGRC